MMKANKKVMAALLAAMMTVSAGAAVVSAATPVTGPTASSTTSTGTWYANNSIDGAGNVVVKYSFLKSNGQWAKDEWQLINDKWYYFGSDSMALCNTKLPLGNLESVYRFGADCAMVTGWYRTSNATDPTYGDARNWEYYSPSTGKQQFGWIKEGANWYYMTFADTVVKYKENGREQVKTMPKGTLLMGGTYTFVDEYGTEKTYTFADNGVLVNQGQGWVKEGNTWYWVQEDGSRFTGKEPTTGVQSSDSWKLINGKYYVFNSKGEMLTGWIKAQNSKGEVKWYYCTANGDCVLNNWVQMSNGDWYLTNASGEMVTGWAVRGGKTYFLNDNNGVVGLSYGAMATGTVTIKGNKCTFDASGALVSINDQVVNPGTIPTL
ncbi:MAG: hypothetical protein ACOX60_04725 [Massiliimalia sp.]|jgi:glucan-binding YG repeat protein